MSEQWAPEPWQPCNDYKCHDYATGWIETSDGEQLGLRGDDGWEGYHISQAERDRIIACVNACAGVPTGKLDALTKTGGLEAWALTVIVEARDVICQVLFEHTCLYVDAPSMETIKRTVDETIVKENCLQMFEQPKPKSIAGFLRDTADRLDPKEAPDATES